VDTVIAAAIIGAIGTILAAALTGWLAIRKSSAPPETPGALPTSPDTATVRQSRNRRSVGVAFAVELVLALALLAAGVVFFRQPPIRTDDLPKTLELDLGGGVKLELVLIREGTFTMGSPKQEEDQFFKLGTTDRLTDEDEHPVEITKPFYLGKFEVTQEQYTQVTGKGNPSWFSATGRRKEKVTGLDTSRFPVEAVSWDDAVAFCSDLQRKHANQVPEALRTAGYRFGLPTEAQWEFACRAGTRTTFHFGNVLNGKQANCDGIFPWGTEDEGPSLGRTERVGRYPANDWGLCDMHGNVEEWCQDYYAADYYQRCPKKDPVNLQKGDEDRRVLRGGSWHLIPALCRAAIRTRMAAVNRYNVVGFRVALRLD
jgi:formylglycine-generating enzyme required for sulfatase activity